MGQIEVGDILIPKAIDDARWEVIAICSDAICVQDHRDRADEYGHLVEISWFRKSELENTKNIRIEKHE